MRAKGCFRGGRVRLTRWHGGFGMHSLGYGEEFQRRSYPYLYGASLSSALVSGRSSLFIAIGSFRSPTVHRSPGE